MNYCDQNKLYIPKSVVIGKLKKSSNEGLAIPSCRYMMEKWTNMNLFERLSGFRPTNNIDKGNEVLKMISGDVFTIENDGNTSLKLDNLSDESLTRRSYYGYNSYFIIDDSRGFKIEITASNFSDLIKREFISIERGGKINGNLVFAWDSSEWYLISKESDEYKTAIKEEDIITKRNNTSFVSTKDLIVGKIYDYESSPNNIIRLLYIGKKSSCSVRSYIMDYVDDLFRYLIDGGTIKEKYSCYERDPWYYSYNIKRLKSYGFYKTKDFKSEKKHMFLKFEQDYRDYISTSDIENRVHLSFMMNQTLGKKKYNENDCFLRMNNSFIKMGGGRKLIGLSKDQNIRLNYKNLDSLLEYLNLKEAQTYEFDDILKAYDNYVDHEIKKCEMVKKYIPYTEPQDINAWKKEVQKLTFDSIFQRV